MTTRRKKMILGSVLTLLATILICVFIVKNSDDREFAKRLEVSQIAMKEFRREFSAPIAPWTSPPKITDQMGAEYSTDQEFYVSGIPRSHFKSLSDFMQRLAEQHFPEGITLRHTVSEIRETEALAVFHATVYKIDAGSVVVEWEKTFEEDISDVSKEGLRYFYSLGEDMTPAP